MQKNEKCILAIDDEEKILEVIKSYFEHNGYKVLTAIDGNIGLNIFNSTEVDLILLDLMLPDISGEEICKTIRKQSKVPIVMLTAKTLEENVLNGLNIGADDYIPKPFSIRQLLAKVTSILRRTDTNSPLFNEVSFFNDDLVVNFLSYQVYKNGKEVNLTPNEFKILSSFISNPNKVFSRDDLILSAFGFDYEGYNRTIDSHIKNIRSKIETDSKNPLYILTVHGIGYKFGGD